MKILIIGGGMAGCSSAEMLSKIPGTKKKLKFQMPYYLAFRVGGGFERGIIKPILW